MAHESFEDSEIAEILNRDYISIKVDREERPDVDAVYMAVCQAMTGSGGWPLTILMTPQQKPFFAGTYLPKTSRRGMAGLTELLERVAQMWRTERDALLDASEQAVDYLQREMQQQSDAVRPDRSLVRRAAGMFARSYDGQHGGFGGAPKFPTPHNLLFLMRYAQLEQDESARHMAEHTLTQMARGGIFDQIGGGFSRYSTDRIWLAPHFEKMLYDNALLSTAYLEAYRLTGNRYYQRIAERTIGYVLRELTHEDGGFFCGQDADSEGVEGKYYVFTPEEVVSVLGKDDGQRFCDWFGITKQGNFEGKSIPNLLDNPRFEEEPEEIVRMCGRMREYRVTRTKLHLDDKVLTSWNALMILALAKAAQVLGDAPYLQAAERADKFLQKNLTDTSGRLYIRWRDGEAAHPGQLEDYAFYALALLELYGATLDAHYLLRAERLSQQMIAYFLDEEHGGYYLYASNAEQLISRPKESYDGALPSGNAAAGMVLARLAQLTGKTHWIEQSDRQLQFLAGAARSYPIQHSFGVLAITADVYDSAELVCVSAGRDVPKELLKLLERITVPNLAVVFKSSENASILEEAAPYTADYPIPEHGARYYLCRNGSCSSPTQSLTEIERLLSESTKRAENL
ncbi:thioredoxin domain-containing protein [Candidatus Soleaferrea massiliensis]|uniref:thioredoxin domain-containing protein n=1 Tax=Candidatus Soleaferrea massiliensis TaxID=1470354 RepID=UPI00058B5E15|nr:thioredoxin domain-containing protein [Candidatus Soleaferrea massiliensis]